MLFAPLGPALLDRAKSSIPDHRIGVVLANREFEAWFLAAADSLRDHRGLSATLTCPDEVEAIRDPKGWLSRSMPRDQRYREVRHQPSFAAVMDIDLARSNSPSFDKLCREIDRLTA